ncbi:MAG: acyltransferase [Clostridiaceae bacterium]|nr:acyltransferase [Clostridiaceae bacterium]
MNKKRLVELELIRAFAFMFIIVQHSIGGYSLDLKEPFSNAVILRFIYTISKPAVPMFIFISAVSLYYTYKDCINIKEFYKKRLFNIVLPYIICSFIYLLVFNRKVDNLFISLLNGNIMFHLWYVGASVRIYLAFPIILFLLNKLSKATRKINLIFISTFTIVSYILIENKDLINTSISSMVTGKSIFSLKEFMSISPIYLYFYFIAGFYFILFYDKTLEYIIKYKNLIIVLFSLLLIPSYLIIMEDRINFYFNDYSKTAIRICFNIISIFFWYYISMSIIKTKNKLVDILQFISHYSFSGYLYHVLIVNYIAGVLYSYYTLTDNYIFPSVLFCILTIIIAPIVCHLLSFIPYSKYIFGTSRYKGNLNKRESLTRKLEI